MSLREVLTAAKSRDIRSSGNYQYDWFEELFLQSAMLWFVNACEVSLMSGSSDIAAEAKGPERERRRGGEGERTRKLDWWPVRGGSGGVG